MAVKPVSIYRGVDSGGASCPCITPPTPLLPPIGNVFVEKIAVMANGDVLIPSAGNTGLCTIIPVPCTSPRIVVAVNKTFVNGVSISTVGDILNPGTGIIIPLGSASVFA